MENYINLAPANGALRVTIENVSVVPGLGRHRLWITTKIQGDEKTDMATIILTGEVSVEGLGGGNGYLGTILPTNPQTIRRDGSFQVILIVELSDDQIRTIESRRSRGDGGFDLKLDIRASARYPDGTRGEGSNMFQPHKFSREDWLAALFQLGMRKVIIAELDVPESGRSPELTEALEYFRQAQSHFSDGRYRLVAESLRQGLNVLVGIPPEAETAPDEIERELKAEVNAIRSEQVSYARRIELMRKALKFAADLGSHPEADETTRVEAQALLHMSAGLLYWFNQRSG